MGTPTTPDQDPSPPEGITDWRNRKNRFRVVQVHYTADPAKRSAQWKREEKAGWPDERSWAREMEISWETPKGEPVFPEFDAARMGREVPILPDARLLRFWDFGHVCAVVLFHQQDVWGRLRGIGEVVLPESSLGAQIEAARVMTFELMGGPASCWDAGDPAGEQMTSTGQVQKELLDAGILLHTVRRPGGSEGSYAELRRRFNRNVTVPNEGPTPAYLLSPSKMPITFRALSGAFHKSDRPPFRPVDEHPFKDVCDALRYGNDNLLGASSDHLRQMAEVARIDRAW